MKKVILSIAVLLCTATGVLGQEGKRGDRPDGPPSITKIFKDLDTNEDGKIALKEAKGPLKKDFKKIDLDEDGFITKKELEKAPKPKRGRKQEK